MTAGTGPISEPNTEAEEKSHLQNFARWLLLVPIVLVMLICCGQLALWGISPPKAINTGSNLEADYGIWTFASIPRILPEIVSEIRRDREEIPDEIVVPGRVWPLLPLIPTDEPTPKPTATPDLPKSTLLPTPKPTQTESTPPTSTATATVSPTPTYIWIWVPSNTPTTIPTLQPTETEIPIPTVPPLPTETTVPNVTPTETPFVLPTNTDTPIISLTPTSTSTPSDTPVPTLTPSETPTPSDTPVPTLTPTETPSPTITPDLCPGNLPPGEPNIGASNNVFAEVPCGRFIILDLVDLGYPPIDTTVSDPDYDVRYYERLVTGDPTQIAFDWVTLQVGTGPTGSCESGTWYTAMVWGDGDVFNNGHLGGSFPEIDNQSIPISALHGSPYKTGISIDLDAVFIPNQVYPCVRIISPVNWPDNDGSEVDAIELLP